MRSFNMQLFDACWVCVYRHSQHSSDGRSGPLPAAGVSGCGDAEVLKPAWEVEEERLAKHASLESATVAQTLEAASSSGALKAG